MSTSMSTNPIAVNNIAACT